MGAGVVNPTSLFQLFNEFITVEAQATERPTLPEFHYQLIEQGFIGETGCAVIQTGIKRFTPVPPNGSKQLNVLIEKLRQVEGVNLTEVCALIVTNQVQFIIAVFLRWCQIMRFDLFA